MYTYSIKKLPKNTLEITITLKAADVEAAYPKALEEHAKHLKLEGFRPGKVPVEIAKNYLDSQHIYEHTVNDLLNKAYGEILQKETLNPIVRPSVVNGKGEPKKDWQFVLRTATRPSVNLPNYKKIIKTVKAEFQKEQKKDKNEKDDVEKNNQALLSRILEEITKQTKVEIADVIVNEELNNRLQHMQKELSQMGLTIEQYLASRKEKEEDFLKKMRSDVEESLKADLAISALAEAENIKVNDDEIKSLLGSAQSREHEEFLRSRLYSYIIMLQRQKLFDFLLKFE